MDLSRCPHPGDCPDMSLRLVCPSPPIVPLVKCEASTRLIQGSQAPDRYVCVRDEHIAACGTKTCWVGTHIADKEARQT
jgi:hypothetical protein